jgi:aromatic ring-opening dioxygenase LigB subunit
VDTALSCGYTGLVFLHGLLRELQRTGTTVQSRLLANEHPTYYGMLVAAMACDKKV